MAAFNANMVTVLAVILGLPITYAGCSARREPVRESAPRSVKAQTRFDYSEHEPYAKAGENGISGKAFLRHQGDSVVTCAGSRVLLLPATSYFREIFWHIIAGSEPAPPEKPYPSLKNMIRRTQCDAQGNFSFAEIPDGTWFILTQVNARGGGVLITEVTLSNHGTTALLLTDEHLVGR